MSLKHKLLKKYFAEEFIIEYERLTPLRRFIYSLGLDYKDLSRKKIYKWARTKQYKDFFKLYKIKKIVDKANVDESFVYENLEYIMDNFIPSEDQHITEFDVDNFKTILEIVYSRSNYPKTGYEPVIKHSYNRHHMRGRYRTAQQRQAIVKQNVLHTVNTGGTVSRGESDIQFKSGKKQQLASGQNKVILRKRIPSRTGGLRYHRKTIRVY